MPPGGSSIQKPSAAAVVAISFDLLIPMSIFASPAGLRFVGNSKVHAKVAIDQEIVFTAYRSPYCTRQCVMQIRVLLTGYESNKPANLPLTSHRSILKDGISEQSHTPIESERILARWFCGEDVSG
jgi:hypothetical protein